MEPTLRLRPMFTLQTLRKLEALCAEHNPALAEKVTTAIADTLPQPADAKFLKAAKDKYTNDDCEFDPDAVVSQGDSGAFVMGWLYVTNEEAGLSDEETEDE